MSTLNKQQQQQQSTQQVYYNKNYSPPHQSVSSATQLPRYSRASFDPFTDLPTIQPFSTLPTRRRHPGSNTFSIVHL